jgi:Type I phosphodiesterase / nucleotide pyrophosphatase
MLVAPGADGPVLPAYGGACLDGLAPGLMAAPGARPWWLPEPAADAGQVVLLVLDGLGWRQLQDRLPIAPALAGFAGGPITSVVPTTTATALTSIALGCAPAVHGVVGYRVLVEGPSGDEILNVLRWRTTSGDARPFLPPRTFQPRPAFGGRSVPVVTHSEFSGSGFTVAHLAGSRLIGWSLPSTLVVEVRRLLAQGEPFVYAYYDGIDKIAHQFGLEEHYDAELVAADRLVADLASVLPAGAALVVTADHGQVSVGQAAVALDAELMAHTAMVTGEGRFRWLHVKPGHHNDLIDAARGCYGREAWIHTIEEVETLGWFGGPLTEEGRGRLGDVAVVPHQPVAYLDPADQGDSHLVCRHGSLTEDEMFVPLLAVAV